MNKRAKAYTEKIAKVVETFPLITKAAVVGPAAEDSFSFSENLMLAIYTKPEAKTSIVCIDLNRALGDNGIFNVDLYMMADEDFYLEAHNLIDDGEVIFAR